MSNRRRQLSALATLRTAYADKQTPRLRSLFNATLERHVRQFADHVAAGGGRGVSKTTLTKWARELEDAQRRPLAFMAAHAFELAGDELHGTDKAKSFNGTIGKAKIGGVEVGDDASNFLMKADWTNLDRWMKTTAESASATTGTRLQNIFERASSTFDATKLEGVTPKQIAEQILGEGITQCAARASMLAQTGAIWAYGEGAVQRYSAEGIEVMEWLTADDDMRCPFCAEMNGKRIQTGEAFFNSGDSFSLPDVGKMKIPGGVRGFDVRHPPLHPNCRCTLIPIVDEEQLAGRVDLPDGN